MSREHRSFACSATVTYKISVPYRQRFSEICLCKKVVSFPRLFVGNLHSKYLQIGVTVKRNEGSIAIYFGVKCSKINGHFYEAPFNRHLMWRHSKEK